MKPRLYCLSFLASLCFVLCLLLGPPYVGAQRALGIAFGVIILALFFLVGLATGVMYPPDPTRSPPPRYYYEQQVQATRRLHFDSDGSPLGCTLHDMHRIVPFRPDGWYDAAGNPVTDKELMAVLNSAKDAYAQDE